MIQGTSAMDRPVDSRRFLTKRSLTLGGLAIAFVVAVVAFYPTVSHWMIAERSVEMARVRIGAVERGNLQRDLSVQGRVVAAFHPTSFSPVQGIVELHVRAGEVVEQGHLLATVASPELDSRLLQEHSTAASLRSALERQKISARRARLSNRQAVDLASVELESARRAMSRAERSKAEGIVNDVEFEQAQDALRRGELALAHATDDADLENENLEFEVHNSELELERHLLVVKELQRQVDQLAIRAPVAGLVSRIDVNDHDAVSANTPLVTVVDLSAYEIEVLVPESYADEIGPGTPAEVRHDGEIYAGKLKSISPEVEGSQVRGIVSFAGSTPQGLRQNQRLSTRLILESKTDVLKVARGPFLDAGGGREAYRVVGDMAELQPIKVGSSSVAEVEILSGLSEGDRIIISDTSRFDNAQRLFLRE